MRKRWIATTLMALLVLATGAWAQDGIWAKWSKQTDEALRSQPDWSTPLGTSSAVLSQRYRSDFTRQITPSRTTTWNYGTSKGLNVIPWNRLEINILPPPYIQHNSPTANDGFGDFSLLSKFRIASENAQHGNYAVGASLGETFPTGSFKNGSPRGTISPTIYAGKGFGDFDVQSSLGANLPTGDSATLGRSVAWNVAAQYRVGFDSHVWKLWPEIENNATYFRGGPNDGKSQDFVTLGMMVNGIQLNSTPGSRLKASFGAGMQIATSHFHTYNHAVILSTRFSF